MSLSGIQSAVGTVGTGFSTLGNGVQRIASGLTDLGAGAATIGTGLVDTLEEAGDTVYEGFSATGNLVATGLNSLGKTINLLV